MSAISEARLLQSDDGDAVSAERFEASNAVRRADAAERLGGWLGSGLTLGGDLPHKAAAPQAIPFGRDELDQVVAWTDFNPARLRVQRFGEAADPATIRSSAASPTGFRLNPWAIRASLSQGMTLVISDADDFSPELHTMAADLSSVLGARASVYVLLTGSDQPGAQPHTDRYDVAATQLWGRKHWRVWAPGSAYDAPPEVEVTADPGDTLWVPAGWRHEVRAAEWPCAHLSFAIHAETLADSGPGIASRARTLLSVAALATDTASASARLATPGGVWAVTKPNGRPPSVAVGGFVFQASVAALDAIAEIADGRAFSTGDFARRSAAHSEMLDTLVGLDLVELSATT